MKDKKKTEAELAAELEAAPLLSLDEILGADDVEYKHVLVPEWKGKIRFGTVSAGALMRWIEANNTPAKKSAGLRLFMETLVSEKGDRIGTPDLIDRFKKKSAKVLNRLVDEAIEFNGLNKKDKLKTEKDEGKNDSGEVDTDASPTDSPQD